MEALFDGEAGAEADKVVAYVGEDDAAAERPGEGPDVVGDGPVLDVENVAVGAGDEDGADGAGITGPGIFVGEAWHESVRGKGQENLVLAEEVDARAVVETENPLQRTRLITELRKRQRPERAGLAGFSDGGEFFAAGGSADVLDLLGGRRRWCGVHGWRA